MTKCGFNSYEFVLFYRVCVPLEMSFAVLGLFGLISSVQLVRRLTVM